METIIIYNNRKGLIKITSNQFGIGFIKIPIKQEPKQINENLFDFLEIQNCFNTNLSTEAKSNL